MRCETTAAHAADYLAGTLPDELTEEIRRHAATCDACRSELDALEETWQLLGKLPADRLDSRLMRIRIDAAIAGYQEALADRPARGRTSVHERVSTWWNGTLALQFAAAAAVLVVGIAIGRLMTAPAPSVSSDEQMAALRQELGDMRQMVTMSLLQQQSASERLEGVAWSGRLERPGAEIVTALLDTLMRDSNVNVRLASIEALKRFGDQELVRRSTLEALPQQSSPLVQIALIDFVLESSGTASEAALRRLSQDSMVAATVRMHAARRLEQLGAKS